MKKMSLVIAVGWLTACGPKLGDPCTTDADCGDLVCHIHEGEAEGECDAEPHEHDDSAGGDEDSAA